MNKNLLKKLTVLIVVLCHLILLISCDQTTDNNPPEEEAPAIPPVSSMQVDLSTFSGGTGKTNPSNTETETQLHFAVAVTTVTLINLSVIAHLAIPSYLFGKALLETPELQTDGKFHWVFTSMFLGRQYQADLAGWIDVPNTQTRWEMRVTQSNAGLDQFKWYEGSCNLTATEGDWLFYDASQPDTLIEQVTIDWENNSEDDRKLVFENVKQGSEQIGDKLSYEVHADSIRIEFYDASQELTSKIVWHDSTTAGYIHVPNYHGGTPARWDENHQDLN